MMLLDLICFDCIMEQVNKGAPKDIKGDPIPTPYELINDSGLYEVNCSHGHKSLTIIDNINFEILFDYSINAIVDGYYREAVSSFTSSMERYFEFFIKSVLKASGNDFHQIATPWKSISKQSERQLGAYIILYNQTFLEKPLLLDPNKESAFRNSVIHKGYIPSRIEAIQYGDKIMEIIEGSLIILKSKYYEDVNDSFDYYGYKRHAEEKIGERERKDNKEIDFACVNIMTTIDVKNGREVREGDGRVGNIEQQTERIMKQRVPRKLTLLKENPNK